MNDNWHLLINFVVSGVSKSDRVVHREVCSIITKGKPSLL